MLILPTAAETPKPIAADLPWLNILFFYIKKINNK